MQLTRYNLATYTTSRAACAALEDMYASGWVCEGEHPRIERIHVSRNEREVWAVTVDGY